MTLTLLIIVFLASYYRTGARMFKEFGTHLQDEAAQLGEALQPVRSLHEVRDVVVAQV
jgi:hypothetical protein